MRWDVLSLIGNADHSLIRQRARDVYAERRMQDAAHREDMWNARALYWQIAPCSDAFAPALGKRALRMPNASVAIESGSHALPTSYKTLDISRVAEIKTGTTRACHRSV